MPPQHQFTTRQSRRHFISILLAVALVGCTLISTPINAGEKKMTELTKNMQQVCVGRFMIAIPTVARVNGWDQKVSFTKIETVTPPAPNRIAFDKKISQRISQLKTSPHETDGFLFKNKIQLSPDSELLVYRQNEFASLFLLDVFLWRPALEMKFYNETTNKYFTEGIDQISKVVKNFTPTPTSDITQLPPGLCIEQGIITGSTFRAEEVAVSGRIDEYPGLGFSFYTQTYGRTYDDPTMLERNSHSFGLGDWIGKTASASTKFLRKGKRELNGQKGEEMVAIITYNGETSMKANAEFYPSPNTLDKPMIEVSLSDKTHDINTHKPFNKNLTQEEFLALWDALLSSIKLRPGAI